MKYSHLLKLTLFVMTAVMLSGCVWGGPGWDHGGDRYDHDRGEHHDHDDHGEH